jgi:hypothetical protein
VSSIMIISTFIVQASFTIVSYDHQNMFIIKATGVDVTFISLSFAIKENKLECLSVASLFSQGSLTEGEGLIPLTSLY